MENDSLLEVESIAERSPSFDLHKAIIGLKTNFCVLFEWLLKTGSTVYDMY